MTNARLDLVFITYDEHITESAGDAEMACTESNVSHGEWPLLTLI